jgi:transposase
MTFLAALRCDEITAPFVLDGPINGESFLAYVAQVLAPALKHGGIVVMSCPLEPQASSARLP